MNSDNDDDSGVHDDSQYYGDSFGGGSCSSESSDSGSSDKDSGSDSNMCDKNNKDRKNGQGTLHFSTVDDYRRKNHVKLSLFGEEEKIVCHCGLESKK